MLSMPVHNAISSYLPVPVVTDLLYSIPDFITRTRTCMAYMYMYMYAYTLDSTCTGTACRYMHTSYVDLDLSVPVDSTLPVDLLVPT